MLGSSVCCLLLCSGSGSHVRTLSPLYFRTLKLELQWPPEPGALEVLPGPQWRKAGCQRRVKESSFLRDKGELENGREPAQRWCPPACPQGVPCQASWCVLNISLTLYLKRLICFSADKSVGSSQLIASMLVSEASESEPRNSLWVVYHLLCTLGLMDVIPVDFKGIPWWLRQ